MSSEITIVEIKRRAEQGVTRPFLCRGDDERWYWVKGNGAGRLALCREWIAGRIAQLMDLPIPPFEQVYVPHEIIDFSAIEGCEELGTGVAFGSEHVEGACDLVFSQIERVPQEVRFRTLFFDWLVQNGDRTLGEVGGNVNVLWVGTDEKAYVIDHNLAFDASFDLQKWRNEHVFHAILDIVDQGGINLAITPLMNAIMEKVEGYWNELPEAWVETVSLQNDFSPETLRVALGRLETAQNIFGRWIS